jgi:hypothetical protein
VTKALAKPSPDPATIAFDPLAATQATTQAIEYLNALQGVTIESDEDAAEAAEELRNVVRQKDLAARLRDEWLAPAKATVARINAGFKPALDAWAASEARLKRLIADFQLAKQAEQKRLLAEAAAAAQARQPEAIATALTAAHDAAPKRLEGVGVRAVWRVKRIAEELLPREWLCADEKKIAAYARSYPADKDPNGTVPGVIFELDASVSAKR